MKAFLIISILVGIQYSVSFAQTALAKGGGGGSQTETTAANLKAKAAVANQICVDKINGQNPPNPQRIVKPESANVPVSAPAGKISKTVSYTKSK